MTLTNTRTIIRQIGAIGGARGHRLEGEDALFARGAPRRNPRPPVRTGFEKRIAKYNQAIIELGGKATEAQIAKHLGVRCPLRFIQNHRDDFVLGTRVIRGVERTVYSPRIDK